MDILTEICEKRRADIQKKGFSYGHKIPEKRKRPVVPFLPEPGTILEIKRASPSKGWIAPELKAAKTAKTYIKAGTSAISCLTEENYFHGSLEDLQAACRAAGTKAAVLRKDFLLEPEEVEIAYLCGADAVLLISRILDQEKIVQMAKKAFELGISVLLEIREDSDIEKAFHVLQLANEMEANDRIVLGINSRDLSNFTIDLLIPLKLKEKIGKIFQAKGADLPFPKIISESGVTTPAAADFVGNLGFHAVLIGEAAARNPKEAKLLVSAFTAAAKKTDLDYQYFFWKKLAVRLADRDAAASDSNTELNPLVKICGLTTKEDAIMATELGADILGFIFASKSPRTNRADDCYKMQLIRGELQNLYAEGKIKKMPLMVGVIVDPSSPEGNAVYEMCYMGVLDGIQYHGCPEIAQGELGYTALPVSEEADLETFKLLQSVGFPRILIDAKNLSSKNAGGDQRYGGTGKSIPADLVAKAAKLAPLWLCGGITPENVSDLIEKFHPELLDISSGIESSPGKKDIKKMESLFAKIGKQEK